jgi:hypothetical protein
MVPVRTVLTTARPMLGCELPLPFERLDAVQVFVGPLRRCERLTPLLLGEG